MKKRINDLFSRKVASYSNTFETQRPTIIKKIEEFSKRLFLAKDKAETKKRNADKINWNRNVPKCTLIKKPLQVGNKYVLNFCSNLFKRVFIDAHCVEVLYIVDFSHLCQSLL